MTGIQNAIGITNTMCGPLLDGALAIYNDIFPEWEREDQEQLINKIKEDKYCCVVATIDGLVCGAYFLEKYEGFVLLGYLFVDEKFQGEGIGKMLCKHMDEYFYRKDEYEHLLIEAEDGPKRFYDQLGYTAMDISYQVPSFDSDGFMPMSILYRTKNKSSINPESIVKTLMKGSYNLSLNDPRVKHVLSNL